MEEKKEGDRWCPHLRLGAPFRQGGGEGREGNKTASPEQRRSSGSRGR